ncbi:MAG: inorganic pyrophosphatase Ppa [Desulfosarcina sp.]|nr:inorganic pyrophosphatase Ppa [Desulfobacterales bacterium]
MGITSFLQKAGKFEVQKYHPPADRRQLTKNHIAYSGSPFKHPNDPDRVILIADPFSQNTFYYEFGLEDITFAEDLPSISSLEDESLNMVRLWVRKGSLAVRCTPFRVANTLD